MLKNRRGQIGLETTFYALAFIFAAAIFIVILFYVWNQVSPNIETALNSALPVNASYNITTTNTAVSGGVTLFNVMFPFLVLGLIIMTIVSAFFVNSHPVFFFISLIVLGVAILLGVVFSNVYQQLTTTTDLASSASEFGITEIFLKNLPLIITIIIVLTMIILFAVNRSSSQGGTSGL